MKMKPSALGSVKCEPWVSELAPVQGEIVYNARSLNAEKVQVISFTE